MLRDLTSESLLGALVPLRERPQALDISATVARWICSYLYAKVNREMTEFLIQHGRNAPPGEGVRYYLYDQFSESRRAGAAAPLLWSDEQGRKPRSFILPILDRLNKAFGPARALYHAALLAWEQAAGLSLRATPRLRSRRATRSLYAAGGPTMSGGRSYASSSPPRPVLTCAAATINEAMPIGYAPMATTG